MARNALRRRRMAAVGAAVSALGLGACSSSEPSTTATTHRTSTTTIPASTTTSTVPASTTSTTSSAATTTTAGGAVPARVSVVSAGAGGGSGEIELDWDAAAGASVYRVERADAAGGPFAVAATVDIGTGHTTVGSGVTNVWSDARTFYPTASGSPTAVAHTFHYVEVHGSGPRYFRVVASNAAGSSPVSVVVCGAAPGISGC